MLARIPVDRRAWIPEEETYVIFSAFVYNNEKYLDLLYNEDLVGFAPKFGCFEMYVCSRQIIVANGKDILETSPESSLQETEKNSFVLRFCRRYEETEEKENDNGKESCPISPEQKEDGAESSSKKKETHSRKEYDGLSILESNLLTFIKLVNVHPDAPPFKEIVDVNVIRDYLTGLKTDVH